MELSDENKKQLLVPKGFAHGFAVLSDTATILYKCDEFYVPEYDAGIIYNDTFLNIDWKIPEEKVALSEKDGKLPSFEKAKNNFSIQT
ncbi:dTDP-4-dehydrorhamnose 3,5-epimerase [subsurface metagenome]